MVVIAPKTARLLRHLDRGKERRKKLYTRLAAAKARLCHDGLLVARANGTLVLTKKGKANIERILLHEYRVPAQALWDGKWRMLLFDVKESRKSVRSQLRLLLAGAGFVRLQDSAWVYPYPCDEFVALVRAHLASGVGELRQVTVDALESDGWLRERFKLPRSRL